jgi:hypothetical protein
MIADIRLWIYVQYTRLRLHYYSAALSSMMHKAPTHPDTAALVLHVYHLREFLRAVK